MAYVVLLDNMRVVVVDGKEGKKYGGILNTPTFSPDSQRLSYWAGLGSKVFVVVDGEEGKKYDGILTIGEGVSIFDSPNSLHYIAIAGNNYYLVEEIIR